MADNIVIHCQHCGKRNLFYAPSPDQLSASQAKLKQLNSTAGAFDYGSETPPTTRSRGGLLSSFWNSEAGVNVTTGLFAGGGSYVLTWLSGYDPVWSVVAGLTAGVGLPLLKVILYAPKKPEQSEQSEHTVKVRIDDRSGDSRQIILDEIRDKRISLDDLKKAARAVYPHPHKPNQFCISRTSLVGTKMSFDKARAILEELKARNFAFVTSDKKTVLTLRGHSFLKNLS